MKKLLLFLAMLVPMMASAYDAQVDGIYYNLDSNTKQAIVTSGQSYSGSITIPESFTYDDITYRVTSIGIAAFSGCSGMTSVTIPNSVTSIGNDAFDCCIFLTSVTIGSNVTSIGERAFNECSNLTSIEIPNSVTSIGNSAFSGCFGLTSIEIPNSVTSIGNGAFYFCTGLTSISVEIGNTKYDSRDNCNAIIETATNTLITGCQNTTIPNSVTSIGEYAFRGCSGLTSIEIPNSVTSIGNYAFYYCYKLTSVTIPNSVTSIGGCAFYFCTGLTSVTIPNSVTEIGYWAFGYCSSLTSVIIPNSVASIGELAFAYCGLTSVTLPRNLTSIGSRAFCDCSSLTSVTIPNSVTSIGSNPFSGCSKLTSIIVESGNTIYDSRDNCNAIIETSTNILIAGCKNTIIPNSMTSIGDDAFRGCTDMISITIPNSVTEIGLWAFEGCKGLTSVTIPNSVTSIGNYAFWGCSGLTSVILPRNVISIGDRVFFYCSGLTSVTCKATSVPSTGSEVFNNVPQGSATLYVPASALEAYKATAPWSDFGKIVAQPVVRGDANDDDKVDMDDVTFITNIILGTETATEAADVNSDGEINMPDVMFLVNYIQNGMFPDYFYFGTTQPTAENYKTLCTSVDKANGATASVQAGETLYMLCPTSWMKKANVFIESNSGEAINFSDEKDDVTISKYTIRKTQVLNTSATATLKTMYRPNLYEYLDIAEDCDLFANYIHMYDIYTQNRTKSNFVIENILHADLENEDSTYTLLLPTNNAWKNAKAQMSGSYNYITGFNYLDLSKLPSILISSMTSKNNIPQIGNSDKKIVIDSVFMKDSVMNANILRNLAYSSTDERNKPIVSGIVTELDTLFSTSSNKVTSINEFISNTVGDLAEMSNGYVRHMSDIGYYPWESYEPILKIRKPGRVYGTIGAEKGKEVQVLQTKVTDDMWGEEFADGKLDFLKVWLMPKSSSYLTYYGTDATMISTTSLVEMDYYLKGAMATKYRVYVVTVPESLNEPEHVNLKAIRTFAFSTHTNKGESTMGFYKNDGTFDNVVFKPDTGINNYTAEENSKIHVMEFDIDVPICYSNTDASPVLFIQSFATGRPSMWKNFDRNLRIAGVFCVPESASEYVKTLKYTK